MKLSTRERVVVALGVLAVLVIVMARFGGRGGSEAQAGSLAGNLARLTEYERLRASVAALAKETKIDVPRIPPHEQETAIRRDLAERAGRHRLALRSLQRIESGGRRGETQVTAGFRLVLGGKFDGLMEFIHALEHAPIGYVIRDIQIDGMPPGQGGGPGGPGGPGGMPGPGGAPGGAPGGPGAERQPPQGDVNISLKVEAYVFPKVEVEPKTEGVQEGSAMPGSPPMGMPGPPAGGMPPMPPGAAPGMMTPPPALSPGSSPAPASASAAPMPASRGGGRTIITFQGKTVTIQGNTVSADGQVLTMSEETIQQMLNNIPPGATVTHE